LINRSSNIIDVEECSETKIYHVHNTYVVMSFCLITAPCETDMDDLDIDIKVNGEPRNESEKVSFSGIPQNYDPDTVQETDAVPSNSITVDFGELVELNVLEIDSPDVSTISIIVKDGNGNVLTDTEGKPFTDVLIVEDGKLVFPENFPDVEDITIIIVSADNPSITLGTDFLGCLHPREYTFIIYYM